jgi:hypothetical protein
MVKSTPTKSTPRSAEHLASNQFVSPLRGTPPSPKGRAEQPVGGARPSTSCGIHDDEVLPPLRR